MKIVAAACVIITLLFVAPQPLTAGGEHQATQETTSGRVNVYHQFSTKAEKDLFITQFFKTFGKNEGVLLASLSVRYTWNLTDTIILLEDCTRSRNIPCIDLTLIKKTKQNRDNAH